MEDGKNYLLEAFRAFDELDEDVFDITMQDGIEKAKEFEEEPVEIDEIEVIDPEAEDIEDIQDKYTGKAILQCSICNSMLYKDPKDITINTEAELANVGDICPFCQCDDGYIIIGEVKDMSSETEDECVDGKCDIEEKEENSIKLESLNRNKKLFKESISKDLIDARADDRKELAKKRFAKAKDDADADRDYKLNKAKLQEAVRKSLIKESDKPAATSIEDAQKWVDYDMKKYGSISAKTNALVKKAGFQIIKDQYGDYEVTAGKFEKYNESFKKESLNPSNISKEVMEWARQDYETGQLLSIDDFNEFKHILIDNHPELAKTKDDDFSAWFDEYFETVDKIREEEQEEEEDDFYESLKENTVKQNGKWVNKGREGIHGKFKTKKEADAQRKAMFAQGYKAEALYGKEEIDDYIDTAKDLGIKTLGDLKAFKKEENGVELKDLKQYKKRLPRNFKAVDEDFNRVNIETDDYTMDMTAEKDGKVTVTTEPKKEVVAEVSDDMKAQFKVENPDDEYVDVEFDEFEEKDFDELGEGYLKSVYENVKSFKTTSGKIKGNKITLEGIITFKSGNQGNTQFVFEAKTISSKGKVKFLGENKQLSRGSKSFTLTGKVSGNKLFCESLNYNYRAQGQDGQVRRIYGTIKK